MQKPATKKGVKSLIRVRELYEQPCSNTSLGDALRKEVLSDDVLAELAEVAVLFYFS
jgi:hypothetical protein